MAIIRNLVVKISADISSLSKGLDKAASDLGKMSKSLTKVGTKLSATVTAPIIALGTAVVKTSSEFEQSMANAASVAGATGEDFERMTALAREMGAKTVFSASDAADALYYMASAGYKVDQMADSIEATLNLASATQYGLADTTDIVIATLNQFGLEASSAERVTNVFASAIGNSMASMDKLANSMGYVGPVANSLGYEIEETVGALSILYNAGYDGSTAGTTLRQALVSLMNPTSSALAVFEELGLSVDELNPSTNDFADIVNRLGEAGMTTSQAMEVFGARGGPGMLALMSKGGDAIKEMTASITGTSKATDMAAIQLDTLTGQYKILKSEIEEIAISFGDVLIPIIRQFISKYISPLTSKLMKLGNEEKSHIVKIAMIAAAIGPLTLGLGKLFGVLSNIVKIIPMIFSKTGLVIGILALVGTSLTYLYKTNDEFKTNVSNVFSTIKNKVLGVLNTIKAWWDKNGESIKKGIGKVLGFVAKLVLLSFKQIYDIAKMVWPYVKKVVTEAIKGISKFWNKYGENIKKVIIAAMNKIGDIVKLITNQTIAFFKLVLPKIKTMIKDIIGGIKNLINKDGSKIKAVITKLVNFIVTIIKRLLQVMSKATARLIESLSQVWEKLKKMFSTLWETIKKLYETFKPLFDALGVILLTLFSIIGGVIDGTISMLGPLLESVISVVSAILEIIMALCSLLQGDFSGAWEHLQNAGSNAWEALKNLGLAFYEFFKGFVEGFKTVMGSLFDKIVVMVKDCNEKIASFFISLFEGIKSTVSNIWNAVVNLFTGIKDYISGIIRDAFNWGKNLIQNIADGIKNAWNSVVDGVKSVGQSIKDFLGFGSPTKKGPGHTADEWIPNLMNMMANDMYQNMPLIENAALSLASTLNIVPLNKSVVGSGTSPFGDLINGLFKLNSTNSGMKFNDQKEIVLELDGVTLARLMMPKLTKEYKRHGIVLREKTI